MRLFLTVLVFALDVWAINSILKGQGRGRTKAGWTIAVIALPVAGIVWWRIADRKHLQRSEQHV